jgi:hypothetical protein
MRNKNSNKIIQLLNEFLMIRFRILCEKIKPIISKVKKVFFPSLWRDKIGWEVFLR